VPHKIEERKIVVVNQAVNYLTVGICNAFQERFEHVSLITGNVHEQGQKLSGKIGISKIIKFKRSGFAKKFLIYLVACIQILWLLLTKYRKHEVFFISLPPMGYLLNLLVSNRFSMLIWDVYPDSFKIMGIKDHHILYKSWSYLNRRSLPKAYRLFTIGNRMAGLLSQYVEGDKIIIQPIWSVFESPPKIIKSDNVFIKKHNLQGRFIVQYSGNIGLTHNVEVLLEIAELLKHHEHILIQIIGKGPRMAELKKRIEEKEIRNCMLLPFQSDEMFPYSLSAADIGVVILDEKTSMGSVPSKSYNIMSLGIPSIYIAGKDSELSDYAHRYNHGRCFQAGECKEIADFILSMESNGNEYQRLSENAISASLDFKPSNAQKMVEKYINGKHLC